jgi:cytochrome c-type biogenesis protein CcmH
MKLRALVGGLVIVSTLLFAGIASAQEGDGGFPTDNDVNQVAKKLYCPVCPNTPLDVCETKACQDWRAQIKDQLSAGWTEDEILDYFVRQYGERVLAEPQRRGFSALVWVLPVIAVGIGGFTLSSVLRSWKVRRDLADAEDQADLELNRELVAKVEDQLEQIR